MTAAAKKTTKKATAPRGVLILVRYLIKKDYAPKGLHRGDIVLLVRNDEGKEYYTTLRKNHHHSCQCKNHQYRPEKECYHITFCKSIENARIEARKAAKVAQQPVVKATQQPVVVSPVPAKPEPAYTMSAEKLAMLTGQTVTVEEPAAVEAPKNNVVDIAQRGALNGAQHAASFWSELPSRKKNIA